ncbi:hypothetical protein [Mucilaginibacter lappiensis]|uniref:hypothetical protein n=1 Tax=Mucilaginibacter lappiensis TaxID=354630 RepID=UPI003D20E20C
MIYRPIQAFTRAKYPDKGLMRIASAFDKIIGTEHALQVAILIGLATLTCRYDLKFSLLSAENLKLLNYNLT